MKEPFNRIEWMKHGFKQFEVAKKLNMNDGNFSRLLRDGVTPQQKERIMRAIEELKQERERERVASQ